MSEYTSSVRNIDVYFFLEEVLHKQEDGTWRYDLKDASVDPKVYWSDELVGQKFKVAKSAVSNVRMNKFGPLIRKPGEGDRSQISALVERIDEQSEQIEDRRLETASHHEQIKELRSQITSLQVDLQKQNNSARELNHVVKGLMERIERSQKLSNFGRVVG